MKTLTVTGSLLAVALLAACGSAEEPAAASAAPTAAASRPDTNQRIAATAAEVAQEARGKIRCPAKVATPARAESQPVDDVVGVRPGLHYDEAVNLVLCTHDLLIATEDQGRGFRMNTYGQPIRQGFSAVFAEDRINKTSKEIMAEMQDAAMARSANRRAPDMTPGTARWYVTTMGMPGTEQVVAAARIEAFAEGKAPTMAGVAEALTGKYGAPTQRQEAPQSWHFTWAYDLYDRPVTETSPLYYQCRGLSNPDSGVSLSPDCGLVVSAVIMAQRDNAQIARTLEVGVVNQARGYETLMATQQQLEQGEKDRQAAEIAKAAQNADKPTL